MVEEMRSKIPRRDGATNNALGSGVRGPFRSAADSRPKTREPNLSKNLVFCGSNPTVHPARTVRQRAISIRIPRNALPYLHYLATLPNLGAVAQLTFISDLPSIQHFISSVPH